jgi:predicted amidohydrolase YtcJ
MLIRDAEVNGRLCDVRVAEGRIATIAEQLLSERDEIVFDAAGGALLPGLHDHHIHLNATAAALASVRCGPPDVLDAQALAEALHRAPGEGWLRGIGYHDGTTRGIDRTWLDRHGPDRPIRIQHRGGRMWIFNSRALATLGLRVPVDGRLIDGDAWLQARLGAAAPSLEPVGARLARFGVTGLTEVTPRNTLADYRRLAEANLPQRLLIMGDSSLDLAAPIGRSRRGAVKLHYHDHDLPSIDVLVAEIARAHTAGRSVASHCVTSAELLLMLAALEAAGPRMGDRIEHAAIVIPEAARWMAALGVTVVTQPHFLAERGDTYLAEVDPSDRPWLYRLRGLHAAGIPIAAGSDAPFGDLSPWLAMAAAVNRRPEFGEHEELTPERALALYTGPADAPGGISRRVAIGEAADLCVIDRCWRDARRDLAAVTVRTTLIGGVPAYSSIASTNPQRSAVEAGTRRIDKAI